MYIHLFIQISRACRAVIFLCFFPMLQPGMPQCHHIIAMGPVAHVQVVVPDGQVGQRYREVIDAAVVIEVGLAMLNQLPETLFRPLLITQLAPRQPLKKELVGRNSVSGS